MPPPSSGGPRPPRDAQRPRGVRPAGERTRARPPPCTAWPRPCAAAFADRARYLGDPDFNPAMPVARLISKDYAAGPAQDHPRGPGLRRRPRRPSSGRRRAARPPTSRWWTRTATPSPSPTPSRTATAPRSSCRAAGFLLNNEMGDFNAGPGLTERRGPDRHRAQPGGPRQADALEHDPEPSWPRTASSFMVIGSPGGRTIINTVLQCILNVVDFGMNVQEAVDAPAPPPPVAARPHPVRAHRLLARYPGPAPREGARPAGVAVAPGGRGGHHGREGRSARRWGGSAGARWGAAGPLGARGGRRGRGPQETRSCSRDRPGQDCLGIVRSACS